MLVKSFKRVKWGQCVMEPRLQARLMWLLFVIFILMSNSNSNSLQTPGKQIEGEGEGEREAHNKLAKLQINRGAVVDPEKWTECRERGEATQVRIEQSIFIVTYRPSECKQRKQHKHTNTHTHTNQLKQINLTITKS